MCNFKYSFVEQTTLFKGIDMKLSLFGRHDQIGNSFLDWGFHHADEIGPVVVHVDLLFVFSQGEKEG